MTIFKLWGVFEDEGVREIYLEIAHKYITVFLIRVFFFSYSVKKFAQKYVLSGNNIYALSL